MGSFGHREITVTATSGVIDPKDFSSNLHPSKHSHLHKSYWNDGPLRHVVKALAGTPCIIVADNMTGFTLLGAVLVDVRGRGINGHGVAISTESCKHPQNPQGITVYDVRKIGIIIPMQDTTHGIDSLAMQSERRELELARRVYESRIPADRPAGHADAQCFSGEVHVSWETDNFMDRGPSWARISLQDIQAASLCDTCLKTRETEMHQYSCPTFEIEMQARREADKARG